MFLLGNNAAGLGNKTESFLRNIEHFKPGVFFIQETKCKVKNKIKHDDYVLFEKHRKSMGGGGLLTCVHKSLEPMCVSEESEVELLVVQAVIGNRNVRLINGYGPQESGGSNEDSFFSQLDIEIKRSKLGGNLTCIQMDANSKLGYQFIPNDPKPQSRNGKMLGEIIINNDLIVVNGTKLCQGLITRFRQTVVGTEMSAIDFFIVCREFLKMIISLKIDEERAYTLTKFSGKTGNKNIKESDHNMLELKINIKWQTTANSEKEGRTEIYNYKNTDDFKKFCEATENNDELKSLFADDDEEDLNISATKWLTTINQIIKSSFQKIRIKKQRNSDEISQLFEEKENLKKSIAVLENENNLPNVTLAKEKLEIIMEKIGDACAEKNKKHVQDYLGKEDDSIEGFNQAKTWMLKKKLSPKSTLDTPAAKKDDTGNLVTSKAQLEKLYVKTYQERLTPNQIKASLKTVEYLKEYLFEIRLQLAKLQKSRKWTLEDLDKALKTFKNNKARDAFGHTYELFKYGGSDLKLSLLNLCNAVKDKQIYPEIFQYSNISSIYKKKGDKSDLNNDRGIFNVVKIR